MRDIAWKRLCCPVDFSQESRAALRVAVDLARRLGAELTLPARGGRRLDGSRRARRLDRGRHRGRRARRALVPRRSQVAIARFAEEHGTDAIVMGTHGRAGRAHSLVGSVAESTVRAARCPVMVVHSEWPGIG
jgi:nucleotide-binding universal stress UspA family protein